MFMPQGWKMELSGIDGAAAKWQTAVDIAVLAEELGYDSIWVYDHFHNVPRPAHEAVFECWTTMAAISQRTSRVRLGQMVGCNSYREPAVLAKITSHHRRHQRRPARLGHRRRLVRERVQGLRLRVPAAQGPHRHAARDACRSCAACGPSPRPPSTASTTSCSRAQCDPKPLQSPHPPIWIGGGGEQLTLRVVAPYADCSNFGGKPDEWARKREILKGHCAVVGRDEETIRKTWSPEVFIRSTEAEVVAAGSQSLWGEPLESWRAGNLVGTPEQVSREDPAVHRPGLHRLHPVGQRLPQHRDARAVRDRGHAQLPLSRCSISASR